MIASFGRNYSPHAINNGMCGEFAFRLLNVLGGETEDCFILSPCDFDDGNDSMNYTDTHDKRYYKNFGEIHKDLTPEELQYIDHAWIYYKGKHYDAETPNGVDNWKDIPHVQRVYKAYGKYPTDVEGLS